MCRRTRAGRHKDASRVEGAELINCLFVVFKHDKGGAQIAEVLAEVVCEAVIVVNDHDGAWGLSSVLLG